MRHAQGRDHAVLLIQDPETKKFWDPDFYAPWIEGWMRKMDTWRVREVDDHYEALHRAEEWKEKNQRDLRDDLRYITRDSRRQILQAKRATFD